MSVPNLKDYGISPLSGFLPEEVPLQRLPSQFDLWENIADKLPDLLRTNQLRSLCDELPVLSVGKMHNVCEQRRAYSVLGFIANAYIWSPPEVRDHLPRQLADPLLILSKRLGLPPLSTFAGLCLWNFRALNDQPWDLSNLETCLTFTGDRGESWFYLVSVALERQGGPCLANGLGALNACLVDDVSTVAACLDRLSHDIDALSTTLSRMSEHLEPHFFYHSLRPYLAGWKNMQEAGLPNGVRYGDEAEYRQYYGGSNGQSSLIQALDIILNVNHHALGHRTPLSPIPHGPSGSGSSTPDASSNVPSKPANAFLLEMRRYMPREHRHFLADLERCSILRPFVVRHGSKHVELSEKYDTCLKSLRNFRSKHLQIVMRYISMQARKPNSESSGSRSQEEVKKFGLSNSSGSTGTGGTEIMPFLKQTRDEVSDASVGDWSRNIMSSKEY